MASTWRLGLPRPAAASLLPPRPPPTTPHRLPSAMGPTRTTRTTPGPARCFSTTPAAPRMVGYPHQGVPRDGRGRELPIPKPHARDGRIPAYPYGPRRVYKQANTGLYGSARLQFGNNVSEKHDVKTPRRWRPNLQRRRLWSESLRCFVQTRVTTRVLRTIDKCGGLDEYLLGDKAQRIKDLGPWGWKLRWRIMQSETVRERFARDREKLGLAEKSKREMDMETAAQILREMEAAGEATTAEGGDAQRHEVMVEMDRMIDSGEEFTLGQPEAPKDEGFMKEERP